MNPYDSQSTARVHREVPTETLKSSGARERVDNGFKRIYSRLDQVEAVTSKLSDILFGCMVGDPTSPNDAVRGNGFVDELTVDLSRLEDRLMIIHNVLSEIEQRL
jgi:hypothetical protein